MSLSYFEAKDKPFGKSYGAWTAEWWKWFASIPADKHPGTDTTGKYAAVNQGAAVWFLAGTLGG